MNIPSFARTGIRNTPFPRHAVAVLLSLAGSFAATYAMAADLSSADRQFMMSAAHAGATEIQASQAASTKAGSDTVKSFATQMVDDHSKVTDELKALADSKGVQIEAQPDKKQQATINKLNGLDGKKYDKEYAADIGVAAHKDAVALFRKTSMNAKDPDVKSFATKTLPSLEHHLQMAQDLKTSVDKQ